MRKLSKLVVCFGSGLVISILLLGSPPSLGKTPEAVTSNRISASEQQMPTGSVETAGIFPNTTPATPPAERDRAPSPPVPARRNRPVPRPLPDGDLPPRSADPADRIAPPGLIVRPGDEPISPMFAYRMEQELDNLVGRFESALFSANSVDQPVEVQLPTADSVAANESGDLATRGHKSADAVTEAHPVLQEVRALKRDWPHLIEQQAFREARSRWLSLRQDLWDDFPLDRQFAPTEIRAMWLDRGSIVDAENREGLAKLFDNMQTAGINTVFFETINAGFPIYPSRVAPQQNPLTAGWDPLQDAVALAHERNMELHAWMWTFAAGNLRHNTIVFKNNTFLGPSLGANPDWMAYDQDGNPIPLGQTKPFYDPANPELREYLLSLVEEIITEYDVDGLQLDYIRYPFQDPSEGRTYGYGIAARRQFRRLTGIDPLELSPQIDPWLSRGERERRRSLWEQWNAFRIEQITSFVKDTSELVHRQRPDITLSAAVFAMPEHERLQKIQQDWNTWAEEGLVDWIVLMSYAQDANRFSEMITPWVVEQDYNATLVIPGIRLLDMPIPVMIDQLQTLRDMPATGYALFATDNLDSRIKTVLNNTQGSHTEAIPQKNPYLTAAKRFQSLQQEWNWLLVSGQMTLQPRLAERWVMEVNAVGSSLEDLAQGIVRNPDAIRKQLADLKQNIGAGLSIQTATSTDYRRKTWDNRLEAIDRFLVYGAAKSG